MKLTQEHTDGIKKSFDSIQSKENLVALLSTANQHIYGEAAKPFQLKSLSYYANPVNAKNRYTTFAIQKKSGGLRKIHAPVRGLKNLQRALNLVLQCVYQPHEAAMGFVPGKSIVSNARLHQNMHYVYNLDLKDFFPSIDLHRVKARLQHPPFNLNGKKEPLAFLIANLCCTKIEVERLTDNGETTTKILPVLPQGAPTSPLITNIIAQNLDRKLSGLAKRFNVNYSRYADDITFSSPHYIYGKDGEFLQEVNKIITSQNFRINAKKTRLQKAVYRQEVTGLVVNNKVNVKRRYLKQIRMWLYYWEQYGYVKAEAIFRNDYFTDKGHVKTLYKVKSKQSKPDLQNVLRGKLDFLKMVVGADNTTYKILMKRFDKLDKTIQKPKEDISLETVLDVFAIKELRKRLKLLKGLNLNMHGAYRKN